jgi:hypothetical protein
VNELHGHDIEDLKIGMHASFVKTITEADIVLFAAVSGDNNARPGSHVPYESLVELRAAYMPDAARAVSGIIRADPRGRVIPRF